MNKRAKASKARRRREEQTRNKEIERLVDQEHQGEKETPAEKRTNPEESGDEKLFAFLQRIDNKMKTKFEEYSKQHHKEMQENSKHLEYKLDRINEKTEDRFTENKKEMGGFIEE